MLPILFALLALFSLGSAQMFLKRINENKDLQKNASRYNTSMRGSLVLTALTFIACVSSTISFLTVV